MNTRWIAMAGALCLVQASCSSPKRYAKYERELASSVALVEQGSYPVATEKLEAVIGETNADPATYAVQRYYANLLLARVNLLASIQGAFLPEAQAARPRVGAIEARSGAPALEQGSRTAHLVAAALAVSYSEDWVDGVMSAPTRVGDDQLLCPELERGGVDRARQEVELDQLVLDARLGFQNKVDRRLDATPALTNLETCSAILVDVGYPKSLSPWIYYAIQAYLRPRDEIKAYPFAVQTLMTREDAQGTLPRDAADDIRRWLVDGPNYSFQCPKCSAGIVPEYPDCQNCHISTLKFRAVRKH